MALNWRFIGQECIILSVADFAASEVLPSEPNDNGVFTNCVNVEIPIGSEFVALLQIARDSAGKYCTGLFLGNQTGGYCFAPSLK